MVALDIICYQHQVVAKLNLSNTAHALYIASKKAETIAPTISGPIALEFPKPKRTSSVIDRSGGPLVHVPYKVTMFPFPAGLPFASQTASFRSRMKSSTLDTVSSYHPLSDPAAIPRHVCVPCKRYEDLADSVTRSDATPSSTFCPQLLECSHSVCSSRTPPQKLAVYPRHVTLEKGFEWPLQ